MVFIILNLKNMILNLKFWRDGILISCKKGYVLIENNIKKDSKYENLITITSIGENFKLIIDKIEFILLQVIEKEYPLLIQNLKIDIQYFHRNGKTYYLENDQIKKLKENEEIEIDNNTTITFEDIFYKEDSSKNYDFQNDTLILGNIISSGSYGEVSQM